MYDWKPYKPDNYTVIMVQGELQGENIAHAIIDIIVQSCREQN